MLNDVPRLRCSLRLAVGCLALAGCISLCCATAALASARTVRVAVYLTDRDLNHAALTHERSLTLSPTRLNRHLRVIDVVDSRRYQAILGFGAAMTNSSDWLLETQLDPQVRQRVFNALFSPVSGIGLNFVRVPIGGSDFDYNGLPYTYDDLPAGETDEDLEDFSISPDTQFVIPALHQMLATNPQIDLFAADWTPPAWMKANDGFSNYDGLGTLLPQYYESFAMYLTDFIQAYASDGIPIWAISPQNEPNVNQTYPGMALTGDQEAQLVEQNLAPAFVEGGIKARIYTGDTGWHDPVAKTVELRLGSNVISGAAFHCYGGQGGIGAFHQSFPDVQNLMTECAIQDTDYAPAEVAIDALRNWSSSVDLWNAALDQNDGPVQQPDNGCPAGCTGLVTVYDGPDAGDAPRFTNQYYQLGQLSKFVQRGAARVYTPRWVSDINTTSPGSDQAGVTQGVDNVAVVDPDGKRVLIAYNNSNHPYRFAVQWHSLRFAYTLGAGATVTFVWQGSRPAQPSPCLNASLTWLADTTGPYSTPDC